MTTVEKFKALLKAKHGKNVENILEKCDFDEMKKFALALKISNEELARTGTTNFNDIVYKVVIAWKLMSRRISKQILREAGNQKSDFSMEFLG